MKIRARVGHHQSAGFADEWGDLRGGGVEEDGLVGAAETGAVERAPLFSATSHRGEGLLRLGVGRAGDAEERGGGLEDLRDVVVDEIETPGWMRAVVVDVVGDVLTHGADVEDAMRVHVETQAADGVEADDVLERELEHGDRGVVGLERERTGEQANPTAEFAVLARGRRRGIGGRGQHAGGCLQASGEVNHVVLALVQVQQREARTGGRRKARARLRRRVHDGTARRHRRARGPPSARRSGRSDPETSRRIGCYGRSYGQSRRFSTSLDVHTVTSLLSGALGATISSL